ncbi:MAG TPA: MFS transporter [Clostridiaceae bacterium]
MIRNNPLIKTLLNLKGNPRACVYTEPMWGIPFNLFAPYISIYMYSMNVTDKQIGLIASSGMFFQIFFSLFSGIITDKLGRRKTTLVFDFVAWSIPCLIWAISQSFVYFLIAAIINSVQRVTMNSWGCLLVEDSDRKQIVNIYSWIYISGLLAAFFAPLSGKFVHMYSLIPTVRVIYIIAFVFMTAKFIVLYVYSTETEQGKVRMSETKNLSYFEALKGYKPVIIQILKAPETLLTLGLMLIMSICNMVSSTFYSILLAERVHIPLENLSLFPFIKSLIMLVFFFTIVHKINALKFRKPLILGFFMFIVSQTILVITPDKGYIFLIFSIILEACSLSFVGPLLDSMQVVLVDPKERARIMAILYVIVIAFTSPFGYIAGNLSAIDRRLPFLMNIILLILGIALTYVTYLISKRPKYLKS